MAFPDSHIDAPDLQHLPRERGFALVGAGAQATAERLFGSRLAVGQALRLTWEPGAPAALVIMMSPTRVEVRLPAEEPWATRLLERLGHVEKRSLFSERLARAIARLEAWHESDADSATSPEELADELSHLRQLAPSVESQQAIVDALEALDDGLPADAVAAALYRAGLGLG